MNFLLDTHVFLWLAGNISLVPGHVLTVLQQHESTLFLSSVSVWEIEQKFRVGKLKLHAEPRKIIAEFYRKYDIAALPFHEESAFLLEKLPLLHGDPFDRMLVCQAIHHGFTIVSGDRHIQRYPVNTLW